MAEHPQSSIDTELDRMMNGYVQRQCDKLIAFSSAALLVAEDDCTSLALPILTQLASNAYLDLKQIGQHKRAQVITTDIFTRFGHTLGHEEG